MRPAGRGELDSLYFEYPHFEPPDRPAAEPRRRVAIVGAGPVGLTAALALAAEGVPSLLLERKATFNDGSRAICIARQSFHILERLGALAPFLEKALPWTTGRSFYRGRQVLEFEMPDGPDEKFRPMYNLQQQYIERFLWQAASASPLVEIRWQSEVAGIADRDGGVTLEVRDPAGSYAVTADWLLAADGARSPVRGMRNLRLQGENFEGRYVIADVRMAHDYPTIRRALFDPACNPGSTVLVHRQPEDIWRIDYQLPEGESAEEATREEVVRDRVAAILGEIGHRGTWELEWWSVYAANTLALADYRDGRVFFLGDAAHIVPIFGVRGLNNGIADAADIGWKLGRVVAGGAGEGLLASYTPERRDATLDVFANATKSTRFMTPPTRGWRLMRDAALGLALRHDFARPFANPRQMAPYTYAASPLTADDDPAFDGAGPAPGSVLPNLRLAAGGFLSDRLGPGFTLLLFSAGAAAAEAMLRPLRARDPDLRLLCIGGAMPDALHDPDGRIAARFAAGPGSAWLVRPDMYIAGRWRQAEPAAVASCLARLLDIAEVEQ
ncbi:FAD-dependent monooxygenase [Marinibaculum pumilum]|uniref:FAD-dependent monooxygenase n=1 Tax=Marinibaculum pumilum TaxID=1766165 RepID=A0ABV7L7M1_9PROT